MHHQSMCMESDLKKPRGHRPLGTRSGRGSPLLRGMASILGGMASIAEGMGSILDSMMPSRRSPRMRRIMRDLERPDAERLRRDAKNIPGWYDMDPWLGPADDVRVWPHRIRPEKRRKRP